MVLCLPFAAILLPLFGHQPLTSLLLQISPGRKKTRLVKPSIEPSTQHLSQATHASSASQPPNQTRLRLRHGHRLCRALQ
ncbi:hypothetical protein HDK77DRAFT_452467 [Phyllosticta capitalensis]